MTCMSAAVVSFALVAAAAPQPPAAGAPHPGLVRVQVETADQRAEWTPRLARMVRTGRLRVREERKVPGGSERDQWLVQLHRGVPVEGAEIWRRMDGTTLVAAEGVLYEPIEIDPVPKLTRAEARQAVAALAPDGPGPSRDPTLLIRPSPDGGYLLVYRAMLFTGASLATHYVDAATGAVVVSQEAPPAPSKAPR